MQIKKVRIDKILSFHNFETKLDSGINIIVGSNGVGKTFF